MLLFHEIRKKRRCRVPRDVVKRVHALSEKTEERISVVHSDYRDDQVGKIFCYGIELLNMC